jgi:hypothetical protein
MASSTTGRAAVELPTAAKDRLVRRMIRMDFDIEGRPFHDGA